MRVFHIRKHWVEDRSSAVTSRTQLGEDHCLVNELSPQSSRIPAREPQLFHAVSLFAENFSSPASAASGCHEVVLGS